MSGRGVAAISTNQKVDPVVIPPPGPPFDLDSAENGLSVDTVTRRIILGQPFGAAGNPAALIMDTEVPLAGRRLNFFDTAAGSAFEFFGSFLSGTFNGGGGYSAVDAGGENIGIATGVGVSQLSTHTATMQFYLGGGTTFHQNTGIGDPGANNLLFDFSNVGIGVMGVARLNVDGAITGDYWVEPPTANPQPVNAAQNKDFVFTNEGAGAQQFDLPAAVAGLRFTFYNQDPGNTVVMAGAGDTLRIGALVTAAGGTVTSTAVGDSVTFQAINSTEWVAVAVVGTWV